MGAEHRYIRIFLGLILSFSLAAGLLLACKGEKAVHASTADASGKMFGITVLNTEDVNTDKAPVVYFAGEPWYVLGYKENVDPDAVSDSGELTIFQEPGAVTLLSKNVIGMTAFDTDENRGGGTDSYNNIYEGSLLQKYLDDVYNGHGEQAVITLQEKNAVKTRTFEGGSGIYFSGVGTLPEDEPEHDRGKVRGPEVKNAGLWPLS